MNNLFEPTEQELEMLNEARFVGNPCKRCQSRIKYKKGGMCVPCHLKKLHGKKTYVPLAIRRARPPAPPREKMDPRVFIERERARTRANGLKAKLDRPTERSDDEIVEIMRELFQIDRFLNPEKPFIKKVHNVTFRSVNHDKFK
jgi:hypothetical protein